jgi:ribosomal protein S8
MKKIELNKDQKEKFSEIFLDKYFDFGFGVMPKREMDILIFHIINDELNLFKGKSNYEIANILGISEAKVKSLRLDISLKYKTNEITDKPYELAKRIFIEKNIPFDYRDDIIFIQIEDPVLKRDIESHLKSQGFIIDFSFNREILKITPAGFLTILANNKEEAFNIIVKKLNQNIESTKQIKKADFKQKTFLEKAQIILNQAPNKLDLLFRIVSLIV